MCTNVQLTIRAQMFQCTNSAQEHSNKLVNGLITNRQQMADQSICQLFDICNVLLYMVPLQLKHPLELFVKIREFLPSSSFYLIAI